MPPMMGMGRHGKRPMKKEKLDIKALGKLLKYLKNFIPIVILAIAFSIVNAVGSIIGPDMISDVTDLISAGITTINGIDLAALWEKCWVLIAIYVGSAIFSLSGHLLMSFVTQRTGRMLRSDINNKISRLPLSYYDHTTRGDILSRVTNDVDTITQTLGQTANNLFSSICLFVGLLIAMFICNYILAFVTIASSLIGFVFIAIIGARSQKFFNDRQINLGDMNGHIEEVFTNHLVVKAYGGEKEAINKFNIVNNDLFKNNWISQSLSGSMMPIMNFSTNLGYALVFVIGVALSLSGNVGVTFGTIMAFVIYSRLFSSPLQTFSQSISSLQQASAASRRVFEILEAEELSDESSLTYVPKNIIGNVDFENVFFGYNKDKVIIHGFNANCIKGQKVAIVGPTGAGKTTIVNLLMRFYELNSGDIKVDGVSTKTMKREIVHSLFDMILQDTWLFKGTIKENLVFNKKGVSDEKLNEVIEAVGLKHFINSLPNKFDTMLDDSLALSEGQKQQLTIARAMIKDAPLLILDEATSSVDTRTELIIQNAMDNLTKGRTSFVIAHRLSTIKNADLILVMNNGDIIETGTHQSLLAKGGFYAELYNSQFEVIS